MQTDTDTLADAIAIESAERAEIDALTEILNGSASWNINRAQLAQISPPPSNENLELNYTDGRICRPKSRCNDYRHCRYCAEKRGKQIGGNIHSRTAISGSYYLITLTLPQSDSGPAAQARFILQQFDRLRDNRAQKSAVWQLIVGGVRALHFQRKRGVWRVHLHIFANSVARLTQAERNAILDKWVSLTGATADKRRMSKSIIEIEPTYWSVHNRAHYLGKPPHRDLFDSPEDMNAFNTAIRGGVTKDGKRLPRIRLKQTFGSFYGEPLVPRRGKQRELPTTNLGE